MEFGHDEIMRVRSDKSCGCEPASEVGFEGIHIGRAGQLGFAGDFVRNIVREESIEGRIEKEIDPRFPNSTPVCLYLVS